MNLDGRLKLLEKYRLIYEHALTTHSEMSLEWIENMKLKIKSMESHDLARTLQLLKIRRDNRERTETEELELETLLNKYDIQGE